MKETDPLEVTVARIDVNVEMLLKAVPMVRRHDAELKVIKVVAAFLAPLALFWAAHQLGIQGF